jgi:predicted  nucleic acid-binding Zn-ribbon protein
MLKKTLSALTWLSIFIMAFVSHPAWLQKPPKRKTSAQLKMAACCEEMKELKAQVANLSSLLGELSKKQESDWVSVVMQVMELESNSKRMESRLTDAESNYSEMNNQIDIMQLQAAQTVTQTSAGKESVSSHHSLPAVKWLRSTCPQHCFWVTCSTVSKG